MNWVTFMEAALEYTSRMGGDDFQVFFLLQGNRFSRKTKLRKLSDLNKIFILGFQRR